MSYGGGWDGSILGGMQGADDSSEGCCGVDKGGVGWHYVVSAEFVCVSGDSGVDFLGC